jgi:hypothetical protein
LPVIPALWKAEAEDSEFEVSLGYIMRYCLRTSKQQKRLLTEWLKWYSVCLVNVRL